MHRVIAVILLIALVYTLVVLILHSVEYTHPTYIHTHVYTP